MQAKEKRAAGRGVRTAIFTIVGAAVMSVSAMIVAHPNWEGLTVRVLATAAITGGLAALDKYIRDKCG